MASSPLSPSTSGAASLRGRFRAQDGFAFIEVLVSALLLAMIAGSVYTSLDGASAATRGIKARAVASGLAQADQERMRAFKHTSLYALNQTYTQSVAGVSYTVNSQAAWVNDQGATAACSSTNAEADYIEITSTVSWPRIGTRKPVVQQSLIAPNAAGLAVQVNNRSGTGVSNVGVTATGPQTFSGTTNAAGCVAFGPITAGNYTVTLPAGCVDRAGVSPVTDSTSATDNARTTLVLDCDTPGTIAATTVRTRPYRTSIPGVAAAQDDDLRYLSVGNSGLPAPFIRTVGDGSLQTALSAGSLFPFTDAYSVFSGDCTGADPGDPRYAVGAGSPPNPAPAEPRTTQIVSPAGSYGVTVYEPALNVVVKVGTAASPAQAGARVYATTRTTGCPNTVYGMGSTDAAGQLVKPGIPYGDYDVCASYNGQRVIVTGVKAYDWDNGTALQTLVVPSSGAAGTCP
jgi:Tfp pilus assembly protein PilV